MKSQSSRTCENVGRVVVVLALLAFAGAFFATPASAQNQKPRTLLELLFGNHTKSNDKQDVRPPRRKKVVAQPPSAAIDNGSQDQPAEKLDNARHILVVGDFMAAALADGLRDAFSDTSGVVVDESTSGSSGIVRNDYYDWPGQLPQILDAQKPALLVVEVGANDRQKMAIDGTKEDFRSDKWTAEYEKRISRMLTAARDRGIPVLWTGLPAFQSPSFTADIVTINQIQRRQVESAGATFVDIWDGFVDENGKYTATGSDINGQPARLRGSDGITLTSAGKDKLAFYVEKYARRMLGDAAIPNSGNSGSGLGMPDTNMPQSMQTPMAVRTQPMSMTDPAIDGGTALATGMTNTTALNESPRDRLIRHGDAGPVPEGRIDNFSWKGK